MSSQPNEINSGASTSNQNGGDNTVRVSNSQNDSPLHLDHDYGINPAPLPSPPLPQNLPQNNPNDLIPNINHDHSYQLRNRRDFTATEAQFVERNWDDDGPLLPNLVSQNFYRSLSNFAFAYSCLDVLYRVDRQFRSTFGDYVQDLRHLRPILNAELPYQLEHAQRYKVNLGLHVFFENPQYDGIDPDFPDPIVDHHLWLEHFEFDHSSNINMIIDNAIMDFVARIATTEQGPSGLVYLYYETLTFSFSIYYLQFGRGCIEYSYRLPEVIKRRNALYLLRVGENDCFQVAINHYFHIHNMDLTAINRDSIKPVMTFQDIARFERDNSHLRIHVIGCEMAEYREEELDHFIVAYKSKKIYSEGIIDIPLFIFDKHYFLVKDLGKLLSKSVPSQRSSDKHAKRYICMNCLSSFDRRSRLAHHEEFLCSDKYRMIPQFPRRTLKFRDWWATLKPPYVIYYDLETYYKVMSQDDSTDRHSKSKRLAELKPIMIGYQVFFSERTVLDLHPTLAKFEKIKTFHGDHCIQDFFIDIKKVTYVIHEKIRRIRPLVMRPDEEMRFQKATICGICKKPFEVEIPGKEIHFNQRRVRHHDHLTGEWLVVRDKRVVFGSWWLRRAIFEINQMIFFSGAFICSSHNLCNLRTRLFYKAILVAHSSSRFDQILFNQTFADPEFQKKKIIDTKSIFLIPKSYEIFLTESFNFYCTICEENSARGDVPDMMVNYDDTFSHTTNGVKKCIHYPSVKTIDSFNHLQGSLQTLTLETKESCSSQEDLAENFAPLLQWIHTEWPGKTSAEYDHYLQILTQKQFFPYSYIKSSSHLDEETLPPIECWTDEFLSGAPTKPEDVQYANEVFSLFQCRSIRDYYDLYLKVDISLLCTIMESWRELGRSRFELDPMNYISLPSYGFSVWLYRSKVEIDLLQDYNQILLFEGARRGGWSGSSGLRFSTANTPAIPAFYDGSQRERTLLDMDVVG